MDVVCEQEADDELETEAARLPLVMRSPDKPDAPVIHGLVSACSPLDLNSGYTYLLLGDHFAPTCVLAQLQDRVQGFVSAYIPPERPNVLFVWQVAVHRLARGNSLGRRMLQHLLQRPGLKPVQYIETTVGPPNMATRPMFPRQLGRDPLWERVCPFM